MVERCHNAECNNPRLPDDIVCQDCADWLAGIDTDLAEMEAIDPSLAELGRRVEAAATALLHPASEAASTTHFDETKSVGQ